MTSGGRSLAFAPRARRLAIITALQAVILFLWSVSATNAVVMSNTPQIVTQNGSLLILLPANATVSVQWMNESGELLGLPSALATVGDLNNLRSELLARINDNAAVIASDRSTTAALLNDKASNTDVLSVQQEAHTYATTQASCSCCNFHFFFVE